MEIHNNLDLLKNQILNARAQMLSSATESMELEAFFYWNTQTKQLLIFDGTEWVDATNQGIIYSEGTGITIGDDHTINVKVATTSQQGIVQFATDAEVTTGTATNRVITPKQLKDSLPTKLSDLNDDTSTYPVDKADTLTNLTSTVTELNQLHESGVVKADLEKLHGTTASSSELNILDGATVTTNDINSIPDKIELTDLGIESESSNYLGYDNTNGEFSIDLAAIRNTVVVKSGSTDYIDYDGTSGYIGLNVDTTVTENSTNLVTSGAVYTGLNGKISTNQKGVANGVATLDENGLVPSTQLPSFVDDVIELNTISSTAPATCSKGDKYYNSTSAKIFTATATDTWGATGKTPETDAIYVTKDTNMSYRWGGSALVQIGADKLKGYTQVLTGDGTTTQYTLSHNLGTRDVTVEVYRNSSPYDKIYPEISHTDTSTATIRFSPAPASGVSYKAVVLAIGV